MPADAGSLTYLANKRQAAGSEVDVYAAVLIRVSEVLDLVDVFVLWHAR